MDNNIKPQPNIAEASFNFSVRIINIVKCMPLDSINNILSRQLIKSSTSIGAQIREARHAESKADFIHKLSIAQKEAAETLYWLELFHATGYFDQTTFTTCQKEATGLIRRITSSILTCKKNQQHANEKDKPLAK
jgi:four helix bundle protein